MKCLGSNGPSAWQAAVTMMNGPQIKSRKEWLLQNKYLGKSFEVNFYCKDGKQKFSLDMVTIPFSLGILFTNVCTLHMHCIDDKGYNTDREESYQLPDYSTCHDVLKSEDR